MMLVALFSFSAYAGEIVFGTYPSNSPENIYKSFSALTEYLSKETGDNVRLVVTKDYAELAERIMNGSVDVAWMGSVNYVKAKKKIKNIRYMVTYQERSESQGKIIPYYHAYIIALKSKGYNSLKDLKKVRFAYVDKDSTSGYAYPRMMLNRQGLDDSYFGSVFFLKKHDRIIEALTAGAIDAGAVSDGTYYNAVKKYGPIFKILNISDPIPLDAVAAAPHVSQATSDKVEKALLKLPEDHYVNQTIKKYLGWPAAGFVKKSDSFYDGLRQALGI